MMHTQHPAWTFDHEFDGGEKSCGELILELRQFFITLKPGARVVVYPSDALRDGSRLEVSRAPRR